VIEADDEHVSPSARRTSARLDSRLEAADVTSSVGDGWQVWGQGWYAPANERFRESRNPGFLR
jgi:hypothetical protein